MLLCYVACDVPVARKTCGFLGHSASHGCSKCTKGFPYDTERKRNIYSDFDSTCPLRSHAQLKANALETIHSCITQTERDLKEKETGSKFSELMRLPYFDCVRFTIHVYHRSHA